MPVSFGIGVFVVASLVAGAAGAPLYVPIDLNDGDGGNRGSRAWAVDGGNPAGERAGATGRAHAVVWTQPSGTFVDLNPAGCERSVAWGSSGGRQVGSANRAVMASEEAHLWSGSAASAVNLHPTGFVSSAAHDVDGGGQVGYGRRFGSQNEALLWSGTAASVVSLHPAGAAESWGEDISGSQQGGWARFGGNPHAALWTGTAASFVDLHPAGYDQSYVHGVRGGQQVGGALRTGGDRANHAMLWTGTAESAVYLHPAGAHSSGAVDTNGTYQVGAYEPTGDGLSRAALWAGTADGMVDLHALLPAGEYRFSFAEGIDDQGNVAGFAFHIPTSTFRGILWQPIPEPSSPVCMTLLATTLMRSRRPRHGRP